MEQFSLYKYLENPFRKVITRDGREVEIVKYDMKGTHFPVLYVISNEDGSEEPCECSKSGMCQFDNTQSSTDLFFADKESTEFEKALLAAFNCVAGKAVTTIGPASFKEDVDEWGKQLIDLAKKELENNDWRQSLMSYKDAYEQGKQDALKNLKNFDMTQQEEKQLLLRDLCARLPYKPIVHAKWTYKETDGKIKYKEVDRELEINDFYAIWDVKPYLRPMSSMTEEEESEYNLIQGMSHWTADDGKMKNYSDGIDYLNSHHFDYRGLIEKGLALEAHEGMYNTKTE